MLGLLMTYYWWVPLVAISFGVQAWISTKTSQSWWWVVALFLVHALPLWALITRWSKNLAADGLLYDFVCAITFYGVFIWLGECEGFSKWQWAGGTLAFIGLIMMRKDG